MGYLYHGYVSHNQGVIINFLTQMIHMPMLRLSRPGGHDLGARFVKLLEVHWNKAMEIAKAGSKTSENIWKHLKTSENSSFGLKIIPFLSCLPFEKIIQIPPSLSFWVSRRFGPRLVAAAAVLVPARLAPRPNMPHELSWIVIVMVLLRIVISIVIYIHNSKINYIINFLHAAIIISNNINSSLSNSSIKIGNDNSVDYPESSDQSIIPFSVQIQDMADMALSKNDEKRWKAPNVILI